MSQYQTKSIQIFLITFAVFAMVSCGKSKSSPKAETPVDGAALCDEFSDINRRFPHVLGKSADEVKHNPGLFIQCEMYVHELDKALAKYPAPFSCLTLEVDGTENSFTRDDVVDYVTEMKDELGY